MRLELNGFLHVSCLQTAFQFHKGAIRTISSESVLSLVSNFNSIKVRLEHFIVEPFKADLINFNSIKVRLEHMDPLTGAAISLFQFHKGAIRTLVNHQQG